jgi:transposase-like protein
MRRRRLGIELRKIREQAELTIDQVANALECSDSKISRIETGQVGATPDAFVSPRRDVKAARRFFEWAIGTTKITPVEVVTDEAAGYPVVLEELLPTAWHRTDRYANNHIEADHGRLKARLCPMRGLKRDRSARVVVAGHSFVQNVRRGHYELAVEEPANRRLAVAFDRLALAI